MSLRLFTGLCGLVTLAVGAAVLCGWAFDIPALRSVLPGWPAMKPNTAIALIAAGAALMLAMREQALPSAAPGSGRQRTQPSGRDPVSHWIAWGLALSIGVL